MSDEHVAMHIRCECEDPRHFVDFDLWVWDDKLPADLNMFFCSQRIGGFWERVGRALRYVFGTQEMVMGDVCFTKARAIEVSKFLSDAAEHL